MADQRKGGIAWTDTTWNPIRGCSRVSEGCRNCYAERMAARFAGPGQPYEGLVTDGRWNGKVRLVREHLLDPLHWRRPRRVFVNSMSDVFHPEVPDDDILRLFMVMREASQHSFELLTKRPERMRYLLSNWLPAAEAAARGNLELSPPPPAPNIWLGVSVEDQATADRRIPPLLKTPAAVRWVSCEPCLGPIDLDPWIGCTCEDPQGCPGVAGDGCPGLNWVIVGAESGPHRRPMSPDWVLNLRDQCHAAGTAFFFKSWGIPGREPLLEGKLCQQYPVTR